MLVVIAALWCFRSGCILYYGDAESHLNISRAIVDSRTPGYDQLGTVWLPVLHIVCLPFVANDWLWSTGLAGTLPVACCFVLAGTALYLCAVDAYRDLSAAAVVLACFALNPNILYLAAIPMTEVVFMAGLFFAMFAALRFRIAQRTCWVALGIVSSWFFSLTRYDGWFLIPFLALWFAAAAPRRKIVLFLLFGMTSALAPLYWIAHNWWETGNALDFFNGPYSPGVIQASQPYPGFQDWFAAAHYYFIAGELCTGVSLLFLAFIGVAFAYRQRALQPVLFLLLTPLFYIWSMHSSGGTPIYVPPLWPHSYYNGRYGIALVPLCAFAAGAIVLALPPRWRRFAFLIPLVAVTPWLVRPSRQAWICWKESQVNSVDRRAWTNAGAAFLQANYLSGQGILTSTGDVTGIYRVAGVHLSETLNIGNGAMWFAAVNRPELFHPNLFAVMQTGDPLSNRLAHARSPYLPALSISTSKFSPALVISKLNSQ